MVKIAAEVEQVLTVEASPEVAYAFFSRPEELSRAMDAVERCEMLPGGNVRWVLGEKVDQGIRFRPDYIVAYEGDGAKHIHWHTVEGNMGNVGDVRISALPDGRSQIYFRESVEPELPITPLMARLIKPLVARELRREINHFLDRVREHLSNSNEPTSLVATREDIR